MSKAIVISGGGSRGSWAFGFLEAYDSINSEELSKYKCYVGTSAGALVATSLAIDKLSEASELFISLTNDDVYSVCPFKKKGEEYKLNWWSIFKNIYIRNKATFGDTDKVIDLIKKIYTKEDHEKLKHSDKELIDTVTDINKRIPKYISNKEYDYETFVKYIFASTCAAPIMSMIEINGIQYVDGGIVESIPISAVIDKEDIKHIDVLSLNKYVEAHSQDKKYHWIDNIGKLLISYLDMFLEYTSKDDILVSVLKSKLKNISVNIYQPSVNLFDYPFSFEPDKSKQMYNVGISDSFNIFSGKQNLKVISFYNNRLTVSDKFLKNGNYT